MKPGIYLMLLALTVVLETSSAAPIPWPRTSQDDALASRAPASNRADQVLDSVALTRAVDGRSEQDRDLLLKTLDVGASSSPQIVDSLKKRMISAMMPGVSFRDMLRWPWKKLFHKHRSLDLEEENDMATRSQIHLNKSLEARGLLKKMASGVVKGARYVTKKLRKNRPGTKDKIRPESQPATPGGVIAPQGSPASGHLSPASSHSSPDGSHASTATQPVSPVHIGSPAAPGSPAGDHISPAHDRRSVAEEDNESDKKYCQHLYEVAAEDDPSDNAKHEPEMKRLVRTYKTAQGARKAVKWALRWLLDRRYVNGRRLQLQRAQLQPPPPLRRPRRTGSTSARPPATTSSRPPGNTSSRPHAHAERSLHLEKRLIRTMKVAEAADKAVEKCIIWLYNRRYYNRRRRRPAQVEMTAMNAPCPQSGDTTAHPHGERSIEVVKRLVRTMKAARAATRVTKKVITWLRTRPRPPRELPHHPRPLLLTGIARREVETMTMTASAGRPEDTCVQPHGERTIGNAKRLVRTIKVAQASLRGIKKALAWLRSDALVRNQMLTAPLRIRRYTEKEDDVTLKATKD